MSKTIRQIRILKRSQTQKNYDLSFNFAEKQLAQSSNLRKEPIALKTKKSPFQNTDHNNQFNSEKVVEPKRDLRRVHSFQTYDFIDFQQPQKNSHKQSDLTPQNQFQSNKVKSHEYQKLNDKISLAQKKIFEMKMDLLKKKQEKQRIIKQQEQQRQKWHKERQKKAQLDKLEKQKKRKENITVEQRIRNLKKNSIKQIKQEENQNLQSFPILEDRTNSRILKVVTQLPEPKNLKVFTSNPYSSNSNTYYVSEIIKTYQDNKSLAKQHLNHSLRAMKILQGCPMPSVSEIVGKKLNLPKKAQHLNKKTLIFDLDETLIHCKGSSSKDYDVKTEIKFEDGTIVGACINIRPYARQILKNLQKEFEIIVFTASQSCYADGVLNIIDPRNEYIAHRLYRQHCFVSPEGVYIKDLRIINRQMSEMVLVDNAAYSYYFQLQNGIPIIPYYQGGFDFELKELENYLRRFHMEKDVRRLNRETFKLYRYRDYYNSYANKLVEDLYINKV